MAGLPREGDPLRDYTRMNREASQPLLERAFKSVPIIVSSREIRIDGVRLSRRGPIEPTPDEEEIR